MEFILPTALREQLVSYDPTLKREQRKRAAAAGTGKKKSEWPLGLPNNLIPFQVIPESTQLAAVKHINNAELPNRFFVFCETLPAEEANSPNVQKTKAIIYHYESVWYAFWFPPKNEVDKYFYGFTFAFKDGASASEIHNRLGLARKDMDSVQYTEEKYAGGRLKFRKYTGYVTQELINQDKLTHRIWNAPNVTSYGKKGSVIFNRCVRGFEEQLYKNVPRWADSYNLWDRVIAEKNNYAWIINDHLIGSKFTTDVNWVPSVESVMKTYKEGVRCPQDGQLRMPLDAEVIKRLDTPYFRKWIQSQCEESVANFTDKEQNHKYKIAAPIYRIEHIVRWMDLILTIWPDVPVDYFQSHLDDLMIIDTIGIRLTSHLNGEKRKVVGWLQEHMSYKSFFHIIQKNGEEFAETIRNNPHRYGNNRFGIPRMGVFYSLRDTLDMLSKVLDNGKEIDPPRRWRIAEFHDHVQGESWKIDNPKVALPQDLFPKPVKVVHNDQTWSFFQPIDTHQLSSWGQAVRNCVGSSGTYAEGVKKKRHLIVLCLIDGQPRFTIQLKLNNGVMSVDQIVDVSNRRLETSQKEVYQEVFALAIKKREEEVAISK